MFALFIWQPVVFAAFASFITGVAHAFTFTNTDPTQCDDLTVTWKGGQPPFRLLIIPPLQPLRNLSIPSSAFQNGAGSFTTQLLLAEHQRVMLSISDATGVSAGGISDLLTVGASVSGKACNTTSPAPNFFYSLDTDLEECKSYPFTLYSGAVQPITITGFVTLGESFTLHPPIGSSYTWQNNLTAGTSVSFSMSDSLGRDGGTSDIRVVKLSGDKSCLTTPKSASRGLVAGAVLGGLVLLSLLAFLAILWWRRNNKDGHRILKSKESIDLFDYPPSQGRYAPLGEYAVTPFPPPDPTVDPPRDLLNHSEKARLPASTASQPSGVSPFSSPVFPHFSSEKTTLPLQTTTERLGPTPMQPSTSANSSLNSMYTTHNTGPSQTGHQPQPRIVVHTDIADSMEEQLELPPQYSDRRTPIPGLPSSQESSSFTTSSGRPRKT